MGSHGLLTSLAELGVEENSRAGLPAPFPTWRSELRVTISSWRAEMLEKSISHEPAQAQTRTQTSISTELLSQPSCRATTQACEHGEGESERRLHTHTRCVLSHPHPTLYNTDAVVSNSSLGQDLISANSDSQMDTALSGNIRITDAPPLQTNIETKYIRWSVGLFLRLTYQWAEL